MIDLSFEEEVLLHEINKYCKRYEEIDANFSGTPSRYEYCCGSRGGIHRGYYCPSLIEDIVVGGVNRGRRVIHPRSNYQFRYGFDSDNRLSVAEYYWDRNCGATPVLYSKEFLIRDGQTVVAPIYEVIHRPEISGVSLCKYDDCGRIVSYDRLVCYIENPRLMGYKEYYSEKYSYDNNGLLKDVYCGEKRESYIVWNKYRFHHDADGKLNCYEHFDGNGTISSSYDVPKSRQRKI